MPQKWKGGGSFVYAELASFNASFAAQITDADDTAALLAVHDAMQATGYLRHDIDLSKFDAKDFAALPLADQKRVSMDCLDANHLYVNLGSLGDEAFQISEEDAKATRAFYGVAE